DLRHAANGVALTFCDAVPPWLAPNAGPEARQNLLVGGTGPQHVAEVDLVRSNEAEPELAVRSQADAIAGIAERRGDRRDEPDRSLRTRDLPEASRIGWMGFDRLEWAEVLLESGLG